MTKPNETDSSQLSGVARPKCLILDKQLILFGIPPLKAQNN